MGFEKIIGHGKIIDFLRTAIKRDRLAHAYIFEGPEGVGKKLVSIEFAKAINCKSKSLGCKICSSCVKVNKDNHPDVNIIEPDGNSIKNKQIEGFQNDILLRPYESNRKIFIIEASDTMTISAQNRLLKILEEPPQYAMIILVTENSHNLLSTIRSRSQRIKFNRIPKKLIEEYLIENYNIESKDASVFGEFSDGSLEKAINIYESEEFKGRREMVIDIIDDIIKRDKIKLLDSMAFFEKNKEKITEILDFFTIWFRDLLLLAETGERKYLLNIDKIDNLNIHVGKVSLEGISKSIDIVEQTRKNLNWNVNFNLSIETMLLNLQEV